MNGGGTGSGKQPEVGSNFAFLRIDWPGLFGDARRAEHLTLLDPRTSCFYSRRTLENLVTWLFDADRTLRRPYKNELSALLHEPTFKDLVGPALLAKANIIRKHGNNAVHGSAPVSKRDSLVVLREPATCIPMCGPRWGRCANRDYG